MIDHEDAKKIAYEKIKKVENVKILSSEERSRDFPNSSLETWEVSTEILLDNNILKPIKFILIFLPDFPLSFPKVLLSKDDFEKTKHIPHVDVNRLVCTFQNHSKPNPDKPSEVVLETLRRSKRIIEDGLNGVNTSDFEEEFIAYWQDEYSTKDSVSTNVLLLTKLPVGNNLKFIKLSKPFNKISFVIHQEEDIAIRFKSFLTISERSFTEVQGFFLGNWNNKLLPPFDWTNRQVIDLVRTEFPLKFKEYCDFLNNKKLNPKLILFSKHLNGEIKYFGWFHKSPNLKRNGFRPNTLQPFKAMSIFEGNKHLFRISPELINSSRLVKRSAGPQQNIGKQFIYSMAGLGSIGSNLVHFLKSDPNAEFRLIDNDILKPENLGRHLLGFSYLNWYKISGIEDYLKNNSPFRAVSIRKSSIYDIIINETEYINESDILIVCIGEENIERWIASKLEENVIKVPILFLWVEPYLAGGHCVYITPNDNNFSDFFDEHGLFKFNIIHRDEYLSNNPILTLKEAGCQSNFTPYAADQVLSFLGSLYPYILNFITKKEKNCKSFTWVGNKSQIISNNIRISEFGSNLIEGSFNLNYL